MEERKTFRDYIYHLFGGLEMSWLKVILFAVITAALTAVFLLVPFFRNTSFNRMGVHLEAWILFAVIIMSNCKTPLESGLKTFVFFLVSQPLIYLFQVPFSPMGWQLFNYYGFWFKLTLATLPAAYIGWYITKENWLSAIIFLPVLAFLGMTGAEGIKDCIAAFPKNLLMIIFCYGQIALYIYRFIHGRPQRIVTAAAPLIVSVIMLFSPRTNDSFMVYTQLPEGYPYSDEAVITVEDPDFAQIEFTDHQDGYISVMVSGLGTCDFEISDQGNIWRFTVEATVDPGGVYEINITSAE